MVDLVPNLEDVDPLAAAGLIPIRTPSLRLMTKIISSEISTVPKDLPTGAVQTGPQHLSSAIEEVQGTQHLNPHLEEVELIKNNEYYICLSLHHIVLLKKIG